MPSLPVHRSEPQSAELHPAELHPAEPQSAEPRPAGGRTHAERAGRRRVPFWPALVLSVVGACADARREEPAGEPGPWDLTELRAWLARDCPYSGSGRVDATAARLADARASGDAYRETAAQAAYGEALLRFGRTEEAIANLAEALERVDRIEAETDKILRLKRLNAIAHLRAGETAHCQDMHQPESCLFPISEVARWLDAEPARRSIELYEEILDAAPGDMGARWLLNLGHMVAGTFPAGVPPRLALPESMTMSTFPELGRFRDIATELGVASFNGAGGAIMDDFDGDGFLDLVTSSMTAWESVRYYHNGGDGTFVEWTEQAGLADETGGLNIVHADYDDDGRLDLLLLRGGWQGMRTGRQRNSLLRQNPDHTFTDVTRAAGLTSAFPTQAAAWADHDLDGDLDLFLGNERFPSELYRNDGDGTFTEVAVSHGVDVDAFVKGVAWGDADNDGDPDLFLSIYGGSNRLLLNEGDGHYVDVTEARLPPEPEPRMSFATWFFDYDQDGWLDLFVGGYSGRVDTVAADYLGLRPDASRLTILRNDGTGHFVDESARLGMDHVRLPMGANFGDVDGDGWLDFYIGTGNTSFESLMPSVLYRNVEGRRFEDVTAAVGMGHLQKGHGIAFGDLDHDGDQDVLAQLGGAYAGDLFYDALFENPGHGAGWLSVELVGTHSNRFGVGARLTVTLETPGGERRLHAAVGVGSSFGGNSLREELGLGDATRVRRLEVVWPRRGARQVIEDLAPNQHLRITEGAPGFERLTRPVLAF